MSLHLPLTSWLILKHKPFVCSETINVVSAWNGLWFPGRQSAPARFANHVLWAPIELYSQQKKASVIPNHNQSLIRPVCWKPTDIRFQWPGCRRISLLSFYPARAINPVLPGRRELNKPESSTVGNRRHESRIPDCQSRKVSKRNFPKRQLSTYPVDLIHNNSRTPILPGNSQYVLLELSVQVDNPNKQPISIQ